MNMYLAMRMLLLAVFGSGPLGSDVGMATRFGDKGDPLDGNKLSCNHQKIDPEVAYCAHRTLPCGTPLVVENPRTGQFTMCQVLDRGPYGALLPNGEWRIKRSSIEPGRWRGMVDLSPAVASSIAHNGREPVRIYYPQAAGIEAKQIEALQTRRAHAKKRRHHHKKHHQMA
jgi:rare lipoprotein A (peptidoglycan hydrolase)